MYSVGQEEETSRLRLLARVTKRMLVLEVPVRQAGEIRTTHLVRVTQTHQGCWSWAVLSRAALEHVGKVGVFRLFCFLMAIKESRQRI